MATEPTPQRVYRAACPNCGAPVEFRSAATPFAVCSFCHSTVVRAGDALRKIGESAEVFDDHSPLQLGAAGKYQGAPFTLVGRLQYRYADGTWNEWHALFETGPDLQKSGWLSEDNGRFVVAFDAPLQTPLPAAEQLRAGAPLTVNGESWSVASVVAAQADRGAGRAAAPAQSRPRASSSPTCARAAATSARIDYTEPARPMWSVGHSVVALRPGDDRPAEAAEKTLARPQSLQCPNCGAALEVKLSTTQSIVCHQCKSVVDVSSRASAATSRTTSRRTAREPQIPLGTVGTLALRRPSGAALAGRRLRRALRGGARRRRRAELLARVPALSPHRGLRLHRRRAGRLELGRRRSPARRRRFGESVKYQGVLYRKLYDYTGKVTYVLGEFYWRLTRDQRTANTDYQGTGAASAKRLNREQTRGRGPQEIVWSARRDALRRRGRRRVPARARQARRAAARRPADGVRRRSLLGKIIFWIIIVLVVLLLVRCGSGGGAADCAQTAQHLRHASQEYQNCLEQPAQRQRLRHRRRLVRRLFDRRRPQVAAPTADPSTFTEEHDESSG